MEVDLNRHDATTPRMERTEPSKELDALAEKVLDAAFKVHRTLGPGLLESVYEICLIFELQRQGLQVQAQVQLPIYYEGCRIDGGLRLDLLVEGSLIVEIKAVEKLLPVHQAQLLTYLKLSGHKLGLILNFNAAMMRDGIKRMVHSND